MPKSQTSPKIETQKTVQWLDMPEKIKYPFQQRFEMGQNTYQTWDMNEYWEPTDTEDAYQEETYKLGHEVTEWLKSLGLKQKDKVLILVWW